MFGYSSPLQLIAALDKNDDGSKVVIFSVLHLWLKNNLNCCVITLKVKQRFEYIWSLVTALKKMTLFWHLLHFNNIHYICLLRTFLTFNIHILRYLFVF